jgi:hypothetical protein
MVITLYCWKLSEWEKNPEIDDVIIKKERTESDQAIIH